MKSLWQRLLRAGRLTPVFLTLLACLSLSQPVNHASSLEALTKASVETLVEQPPQPATSVHVDAPPAASQGNSNEPTLLKTTDLTLDGCFNGTFIGGGWTVTNPATIKSYGPPRRWIQQGGGGHVYEWDEPTLKPCPPTTPFSSLNTAQGSSNLIDWTMPQPHGGQSDGFVPPTDTYSYIYGGHYDFVKNWYVISWMSGYTNVPSYGLNSLAAYTLPTPSGNTGTMNLVTCFGLENTGHPTEGEGYLDIPQWFINSYLSPGQRWGVGLGGIIGGLTSVNSAGLAVRAIVPPDGTAGCTFGVDNTIPATQYKILSYFGTNEVGPQCTGPDNQGIQSGQYIDCVPGSGVPSGNVSPTTPFPMIIAPTTYSYAYYRASWERWNNHGWLGAGSFMYPVWYDDGNKTGIVNFYSHPSGSMNTTVLASPAPTADTPCNAGTCNLSFSVDPSAFHPSSFNIQPGDFIWINTCDPAIDSDTAPDTPGPCIDHGNCHDLSEAIVSTVNVNTGAISAVMYASDNGNGITGHRPHVGGPARMGAAYCHAAPKPSRTNLYLQIIDPLQLGQVSKNQRNMWDVSAAEDVPLSNWAAPWGCPGGCNGIYGIDGYDPGHRHRPVSAVADPVNHKIIVMFENPNSGALPPYMFMVFSVH